MPIKEFLSFFEGEEEINISELGDTWHPVDGFVNESYFKYVRTVNDFRNIDYDFRGLVMFKGHIGQCEVNYDGESYKVCGIRGEIERMKEKLRAGNGWQQKL